MIFLDKMIVVDSFIQWMKIKILFRLFFAFASHGAAVQQVVGHVWWQIEIFVEVFHWNRKLIEKKVKFFFNLLSVRGFYYSFHFQMLEPAVKIRNWFHRAYCFKFTANSQLQFVEIDFRSRTHWLIKQTSDPIKYDQASPQLQVQNYFAVCTFIHSNPARNTLLHSRDRIIN